MFDFFSRKKQSQSWNSSEEFMKDLGKKNIPLQVKSKISFYDKDFELFVPVLNRENNIWHKLELHYDPMVHDSKLDCLKYITAMNNKTEPLYVFEVFKNVAGTNVNVNIINLKLLYEFQTKILKACKNSLDNNTDTLIDIPIFTVKECLELLVYYEDFYKMPQNVEILQELFTSYKLRNVFGIFLKIYAKKNGITKIDNIFKISEQSISNSKVSVYTNSIPDTYSKYINIYKKFGTGWEALSMYK